MRERLSGLRSIVRGARDMLGMDAGPNQRRRTRAIAAQFLLGIAGLGLITLVCFRLGFGPGRTSLAYVTIIALVSLLGSFIASVVLSIIAAACLDYFFGPVFNFGAEAQNDVFRIVAFLITAVVVTALTTKLKRAQDEFLRKQAQSEKAERIAHFGWWERDFTTNHVSLSDEVHRIFGVQPAALPEWHQRWLDLIHPEDRARVAEAASAALLPGGPRYDIEYRIVRPDGSPRTVHSYGDVTWDDSGRPLRQFGILQDITELRQTERDLRASEARFRTFVDYAGDAFYLLDDHSTVLDVNRQACEDLGYSRQELIGKNRHDFDIGLDEVAIHGLKQLISAGQAVTFETRHRRKNGTSFPVELRVCEFEQDGRRFLCLARNITDRKHAEDELRASEERFRTLVQFSFDVYWESDEQHRFTRQDFAEGLSDAPAPGSEIGRTRWEVPYLEPDEAGWRKHRETLDAHLPFRDFELARPAPEGGKRYVSVSGLPVFDKAGCFVGYRGVGRHITERKRAERELFEMKERFRVLAESSLTAIYFIQGGRYEYVNPAFAALFGYTVDEIVGHDVGNLAHPDDRPKVKENIRRRVEGELEELRYEWRGVRKDGSVFPTEVHGRRIELNGKIGVMGTLVDNSERVRAQEEHERLRLLEADLAHMNRLSIMGELTASLAHEILHPIATARNNARAGLRFLQMDPPNLDEVSEALECVVKDSDRARDIVGRIRDQIKKSPPRNDRFDFNEAITDVIGMAQNPIDRNRISVRTCLTEHPAFIQGDRVQLQQVVLNLILNAVEAMSSLVEGVRELSLSTKLTQKGGIVVTVRDSGPGIEPERYDQLFKPFYTTKANGIGMGLAICRSIIDAHGGRLWIEANEPRGAVFQFAIPMAQEP